ncbi:bifunctional copper resistance protein CopD/cytochrome c oxidase assembly protein [Aeromicrobium fastidiosum]|uniref:cytochrome c oxidase assembly protein n=1 Tax=Aeromicrobium fastidiosum TaxID=52699 RepID=UPI002023572F|nr:cytochrome c oxidase assembly protein [Aeromicrobium fastidiosum]MCL8251120.1 bifunctional copper resistance protein CopD/cytochrome c oxidase assembly protein [Aeromicrobium fastidiosum]
MTQTLRDTLVGFIIAGLTLTAFLVMGGGAYGKAPIGIADPGVLVGWALPFSKVLNDVAAVMVIGFLAAAAFLVPSTDDEVQGLSVQAVRLASRWATVWAVVSVVYFFLLLSGDIFGKPLTDVAWADITGFLGFSEGRAILLQALGAAVIAVATRFTLGIRSVAGMLGVSLATLAPIALTGHSASSGSHDLATTSLYLHVLGVTLWVGGLAALGWVAIRGSKRLEPAVARYSTLALWSFVVVGVSGLVNAAVRLRSLADVFGTSYGLLVVAKVVALVALGAFGVRQRRRIVAAGSGFVRLATTELFVMAAAIGLAVALSRTPTPVGDRVLQTPAEELLGGPLPAAPTVLRLLWGWSGNGVGLAIVALGVALYLRGVVAMRRRGDAWPIGRTISWTVGMVVIAWATFGGLGEYSHVLFSAHMASHMMLSMVAPIFLALGAPMTLALRTLPGPRQPGEVSPRAILLSFLQSRFSRVVTHPVVGPVLFVGSLYGLYFTGIFEALMSNHLGHAVMEVHFLAVGLLFYYVLIGIDPSPHALAPVARFGALLVTVPFHAFFAIAVMSSNTVFALDYWRDIDRPYRTDLLADQYLGGGMAWAMGEIPLVLVMVAILFQWFRSDSREAKRFDRAEDRTEDAALEAYNARLRDLAEHGKRRDPNQ